MDIHGLNTTSSIQSSSVAKNIPSFIIPKPVVCLRVGMSAFSEPLLQLLHGAWCL